MRGLSPVVASGGHSSSWCTGLSLLRPLLLWSTGSRRAGSVIVAHGPSCSAACGIFPDQGSNLCPLHSQADSQPLHHQGSPDYSYYSWRVALRLYVGYIIRTNFLFSVKDISLNKFAQVKNLDVFIFLLKQLIYNCI